MEYTLNAKAAKQADSVTSRIEAKGKYFGVITRAESVTSKSGGHGIDMSFKADTGETADYLSLWTHDKDGNVNKGPAYPILMAIMACLRVKDIKPEGGEVEKWNAKTSQRIKVSAPLFKALMNKPLGLLIHMEEYQKNDGSVAWKPQISAPFDAAGFTAGEILGQAKAPGTVDKIEQSLRDRPLKTSPSRTLDALPAGADNYPGPFGDMDDDIPF